MITATPQNEIIHCESYYKTCDYAYDQDLDFTPGSGIVHVHMDQIKNFFNQNGNNGRDYTIVSSRSDIGLFYQKRAPVWADMLKWLTLIPYFEETEIKHIGYNNLTIPSRKEDGCLIDDKYSAKCWSFTHYTFDEIPKNIKKWYAVNCMVDEAHGIPFGVKPGTEEGLSKGYTNKKDKTLYVNFQMCTSQRKAYIDYFNAAQLEWVTLRQERIPSDQYINEMASHKFILCPDGNGPDCYRTWEALYLGSIPIVSHSKATSYFDDLPILFLNQNDGEISKEFLEEKYEEISSKEWNMEKITRGYWNNRIRQNGN